MKKVISLLITAVLAMMVILPTLAEDTDSGKGY